MEACPSVPFSRRAAVLVVAAGLAAGLLACGSDDGGGGAPAAASPTPAAAQDEQALLDAAFRVDIERIEASFDIRPGERRVDAQAVVTFRMRPGQSRAVFHFDPALTRAGVGLRLDGETLDVARDGDVRLFGTPQPGIELQRVLAAGAAHRLEAAYTLPLADPFGRFFTDVNDLVGRGNEAIFPTLNTPHELAEHRLVFRVHAAPPYRAVGSGLVTRTSSGDVQEWVLDTERPVASYTVLAYLVPDGDVAYAERTIAGVDVRVVAYQGGAPVDDVFAQMETWLPELDAALGPFPMPRGLSVVLTQGGGGMEYFGGTITSSRALRHEVFHMYFACSTVAKTYRDSWWDEAIDSWYEASKDPAFPPIPATFESNIVSGRSATAVGFDRRAYDEGARIFEAVARDLGGREALVAYLRGLHARRSFAPFTTLELADDLRAQTGVDVRERFQRWLYTPGGAAASRGAYDWLHQVDLAPPPGIRPLDARTP